jgi:hypothetical protein
LLYCGTASEIKYGKSDCLLSLLLRGYLKNAVIFFLLLQGFNIVGMLRGFQDTTNTQNLSKALNDERNANPDAFAALQTATTTWADFTDKSNRMEKGRHPAIMGKTVAE